MTEEANTEKAPSKSIVDPKYRNKYKGEDAKDWLSHFIDNQCRVKSEDGKSSLFDVERLFSLALANGSKSEDIAKSKTQSGTRGWVPRMRMTYGNSLRAAAKKRFGLYDLGGEFQNVDDGFKEKFNLTSPTHSPDGTKIKALKAEAEEK